MKLRLRMLSLAAAAATLGCGGDADAGDRARVVTATVRPAAAGTEVSRDESLRRFREGVAPVAQLAGVGYRDSLVGRFVNAVSAHDSTTLRALMIDRAEFAYLVYPTSPQGLPPYDLMPGMMWDLLVRQSNRGVHDALRLLGGKRLRLITYECAGPAVEGDNRIWSPCVITVGAEAETIEARLTGPIIERAGRFKFVSYTNDLD